MKIGIALYTVIQGSATYGPPRHFTRPATFYCHPARDHFSFFNDRYAAINRRNDCHLLAKTFCGLHHLSSEKKAWISGEDVFDFYIQYIYIYIFFFSGFAINSTKKRPEFLVKTFFFVYLFWSSPSICLKKGLNFWRRPFSFGPMEWWQPAGTLLGLNVAL